MDRALTSIEAQAAGVRRRVNRFLLERAVFVIGGILLSGASLLVVLAFVLSRTPYAVMTWLVLTALAVAILGSLRVALRGWLRRSDAVLRIDHQSALEDRLATLAAAPGEARRSRLWEFLLHENLRLMPRWEPRRFQPRAMPRSVWFFACSAVLALLILWSTMQRGRGGASESGQRGEEPNESPTSQEATSGSEGGVEVSGTSFLSELPESLRQAILGSQASRTFSGSIPEKTLPVDDERGGPAIAGQHMTNGGRVRSAPASPDAARAAGQGASPPSVAPPPNRSQPPSGAGEATSQPARGEAPKALERVQTGHPRDSNTPSRTSQAKTGGGSGSGGSGAGMGGDKDGLFGERQAAGKGAGSFALDLDALRSTQPSKEGERDGSPMPPSSRLAEDQRLDDAVRRAQVPVEYESIVQRIFNRGDEATDRLQPEGN